MFSCYDALYNRTVDIFFREADFKFVVWAPKRYINICFVLKILNSNLNTDQLTSKVIDLRCDKNLTLLFDLKKFES